MSAKAFIPSKKIAMKTISTLKTFVFLAFGLLILQACSSDSYGDGGPETTNNNTVVNEQSGSGGESDPYGESGSTSESGGGGSEAPDPFSFDITNSGASAYVFNSNDLENEQNPTITLKRGEIYTLNMNSPGHPLIIKSVQEASASNPYNEGITNNGIDSGTITIEVTEDTPDTLYYICEFHSSMAGTILIED